MGRRVDLLVALVAAGLLVAATWLVPADDTVHLPDGRALTGLCWVHAATGLDCPFCGMTRSVVAFVHGDVAASVRWHPAGPLLAVGAAFVVASVAFLALRGAPPLCARPGFVVGLTVVTWVGLLAGFTRIL